MVQKKIVVTDDTWKLNVDGPIRTNNEYDGEEYDATKDLGLWKNANYNDKNWLMPEMVQAPLGKCVAQMSPSMKVKQTIIPIAINKIQPNKYIVDMGQNFAGIIKLSAVGNKGIKIKMRYAESLQANGELYIANLRDAKVTDVFTLKGYDKSKK